MEELQITAILSQEKGRALVQFDNGMKVLLYKGEIRRLSLKEGEYISEALYEKILKEIVGMRAKKRAMHLLERMDRTESQLAEKLRQNGYPDICVEDAIAYVKSYHYIDDTRYAENYVRFHQQKKSRQRLKMDLYAKGIDKATIEDVLEQTFSSDEREKIRRLLEKRHFDYGRSDRKEQQKTYQFLMRRGFQSSDILQVMKSENPAENFDAV